MAGIISALGIGTGSIFHTLLAAFGLSIIVAKSILLFNLIKFAGAAYLLYIGYKMLTEKTQPVTDTFILQEAVNYWKLYREGIFTNVLNPKVALFFIAFLPQFIDSTVKNTVFPFLILGATFITTGTIWGLLLANFSSTIFNKLKANNKSTSYLNRFCGLLIIGLGVRVAFSGKY